MHGDWIHHAAIQIVLGFELCTLGTLSSSTGQNACPEIIIAFACYAPAVLMAGVMVVNEHNMKGNKIAIIITIGLLITSGVFAIVGISVEAGEYTLGAYSGTLEFTSGIMAFLGAVFLIISCITNRVEHARERREERKEEKIEERRIEEQI